MNKSLSIHLNRNAQLLIFHVLWLNEEVIYSELSLLKHFNTMLERDFHDILWVLTEEC